MTNTNEQELLSLLEERIYEEAYDNLYTYLKASWDKYDVYDYVDNWHVQCLCEHVQEFLKPNSAIGNKLVVTISPRSGKSRIVTVGATTWQWLRKPTEQFLHATHSEKLYVNNIGDIRKLMSHPWYKDRWCDKKNNPDNYKYSTLSGSDTKTRVDLQEGGYIIGTSVGAMATGFGCSIINIDDILDAARSVSRVEVEKANRFYTGSLRNRINDKRASKIMVTAQRLVEDDLPGYIIDNEECFHLNIPMEFDKKRTFFSPIGFNDPRKVQGELMDKIKFPAEFLAEERKNKAYYYSRYLQNPTPEYGINIQPEWFQYYTEKPHEYDCIISAWDFSFGDSPTGSYTVGIVVAKSNGNYYVIDMNRDKLEITGQLDSVRDIADRYSEIAIHLVEQKANGSAVVNSLQHEIEGFVLVDPKINGGSKEQRLNATIPLYTSGKIFLPTDGMHTWVPELIKELTTFPRGANSDIVDALTYALLFLREYNGNTDMILASWQEKRQDYEYMMEDDYEDKSNIKNPYKIMLDDAEYGHSKGVSYAKGIFY